MIVLLSAVLKGSSQYFEEMITKYRQNGNKMGIAQMKVSIRELTIRLFFSDKFSLRKKCKYMAYIFS